MIELPITGRGMAIGVGLVLLGVVALYASSMWTVLLAAFVLLVVGYLCYIVGYRIDQRLKNGF
ncbi:MAG: hypothetical protein ACOCQY_05090 [Halorhabdus sp.]